MIYPAVERKFVRKYCVYVPCTGQRWSGVCASAASRRRLYALVWTPPHFRGIVLVRQARKRHRRAGRRDARRTRRPQPLTGSTNTLYRFGNTLHRVPRVSLERRWFVFGVNYNLNRARFFHLFLGFISHFEY